MARVVVNGWFLGVMAVVVLAGSVMAADRMRPSSLKGTPTAKNDGVKAAANGLTSKTAVDKADQVDEKKKPTSKQGCGEKANGGKKTDADQNGKGDKKPEGAGKKGGSKCDDAPPTHQVGAEPFKITLQWDGVFEAKKTYEISLHPEEWTCLTIKSAVPHGARVREGDVLLTLDMEKIDLAIDDLRTELKLADVAMRLSESQLAVLEKVTPWDTEWSERMARITGEEKKYFNEVSKPFSIRLNDFSLKMAEISLEYEQEELHQLEKMYKADDITEETEQIVLKRARDSVEKAKFMVDYVKLNREETLKYTLPRMEEVVSDAARRKTLEMDKSKVDSALVLQRQRLELERQRTQRGRSEDRLKKLLADRDAMTVKAPHEGIVYYGKCVRGRFSDSLGMTETIARNGNIQPNQVFMTIVEPRPMFVRATVSECELQYARPGLEGSAAPTAFPETKLKASLDDVDDIPLSPGSFEATFQVKLGPKDKFLMPGMTCKLKMTPYVQKEAITIPPKALMTDELDDDAHYVWLVGKDAKPKKQTVTIGKKNDKQIEVLSGLSKGDKVLLEAPKAAKDEK